VTRVVSSPGYKTKAVVKIVNGNGTVVSGVVVTGKSPPSPNQSRKRHANSGAQYRGHERHRL